MFSEFIRAVFVQKPCFFVLLQPNAHKIAKKIRAALILFVLFILSFLFTIKDYIKMIAMQDAYS